MLEIQDVISQAAPAGRVLLASLLGAQNSDPLTVRKKFHSEATSVWQKLARTKLSYADILLKVGKAHGYQPYLCESGVDFEKRLITGIAERTINEIPIDRRNLYLRALSDTYADSTSRSLIPQSVGAGSIIAAQASGFGVYQAATTVMGMASSAAGVTIPFIGYMALTKSIFYLIGPLGWLALGFVNVA